MSCNHTWEKTLLKTKRLIYPLILPVQLKTNVYIIGCLADQENYVQIFKITLR